MPPVRQLRRFSRPHSHASGYLYGPRRGLGRPRTQSCGACGTGSAHCDGAHADTEHELTCGRTRSGIGAMGAEGRNGEAAWSDYGGERGRGPAACVNGGYCILTWRMQLASEPACCVDDRLMLMNSFAWRASRLFSRHFARREIIVFCHCASTR